MTAASRPGFRRRRRIVWISAAALTVTVIVIAAIAAVNRLLGPPVIRVGPRRRPPRPGCAPRA
jgi:hypothetical protein